MCISFLGGSAVIANVQLTTIPNNDDGTFSLEDLKSRIRGDDIHEAKTMLAIVENTHNICGGKVIPLDWLDQFATVCKSSGLKMHMDGARVFHSAEYLNVPVSRIARDFDSLTFCLSKSLCAPVGSVLVGSKDFIRQARRMRKLLGGGMRQGGFLAVAGLISFDEIVPHLDDVHKRTKKIAQAIYDLKSPYVTVDIDDVQTNICMIKMLQPKKYTADYLVNRLQQIDEKELNAGVKNSLGSGVIVKASARSEWDSIRYVLYHHINDELTDLAIKKLVYCINELD